MRARHWLGIAIIGGSVIGLIAGVGVLRAAPAASAWATGINAGLLASTFIAILWYSWETRKLVDSQQQSSEIARHPWLSSTTLRVDKVDPPPEDAPYGCFHFHMRIDNHGRTPAYMKEIRVKGDPSANNDGYCLTPRGPFHGQVIVPGDYLDLRIGTLRFTGPRRDYVVDTVAQIEYRTADGGAGSVTVGFRYTDDDYINLDTTYSFTLSDGTVFQP